MACDTAFFPVVASRTRRVSLAAPGNSRSMTLFILASSFIRFFLLCSRPAVSQMTTSVPRAFAAARPSNITADGSAPSACFTMGTSTRSAQMVSCSAAAARNVSAATRSTDLPCSLSMCASLAMVVVLPTPLTPIITMTSGVSSVRASLSPLSRKPATMLFICALTPSAS